jgi:hypothetical protein
VTYRVYIIQNRLRTFCGSSQHEGCAGSLWRRVSRVFRAVLRANSE